MRLRYEVYFLNPNVRLFENESNREGEGVCNTTCEEIVCRGLQTVCDSRYTVYRLTHGVSSATRRGGLAAQCNAVGAWGAAETL